MVYHSFIQGWSPTVSPSTAKRLRTFCGIGASWCEAGNCLRCSVSRSYRWKWALLGIFASHCLTIIPTILPISIQKRQKHLTAVKVVVLRGWWTKKNPHTATFILFQSTSLSRLSVWNLVGSNGLMPRLHQKTSKHIKRKGLAKWSTVDILVQVEASQLLDFWHQALDGNFMSFQLCSHDQDTVTFSSWDPTFWHQESPSSHGTSKHLTQKLDQKSVLQPDSRDRRLCTDGFLPEQSTVPSNNDNTGRLVYVGVCWCFWMLFVVISTHLQFHYFVKNASLHTFWLPSAWAGVTILVLLMTVLMIIITLIIYHQASMIKSESILDGQFGHTLNLRTTSYNNILDWVQTQLQLTTGNRWTLPTLSLNDFAHSIPTCGSKGSELFWVQIYKWKKQHFQWVQTSMPEQFSKWSLGNDQCIWTFVGLGPLPARLLCGLARGRWTYISGQPALLRGRLRRNFWTPNRWRWMENQKTTETCQYHDLPCIIYHNLHTGMPFSLLPWIFEVKKWCRPEEDVSHPQWWGPELWSCAHHWILSKSNIFVMSNCNRM